MERMRFWRTQVTTDILLKEWVLCMLRTLQISNGKNGFSAYKGHCDYLLERMDLVSTEVTADI